ncbi:Protein of unknown function [Cotesia congregata]|uniref:Uncharacterized protein n=1 Tax=Cotesia congregata TaxID=51543 RepID=A0A8J2MT54_COTCN|nr:Protein of unknown function [Cotesia congregata]
MTSQEYYSQEMNLVEVIRDELRQATIEVRRNHRTEEQNKRRALGEIIKNDDSWTLDTIIKKTKDLRKKPLSIDDYIKLQNSLIQDEENIKGFLSVGGSIAALIRDLTSIKPSIELAAAHCCCNIALGNKSQCTTLCKYAGPYLVEQLDTLSNPLLEISAWTVGNLCGGSKNAFKALYAQGCLCRLLSLLRDCDIIILPSIIYAVTQCLNEGFELINDLEAVEMSKGIIERGCYDNSSGIWVLALLSSKLECRETLCTILSSVFDLLMIKINEEPSDTKLITAAMRLLANLIPESTGFAANVIFYNPKYSITDVEKLFNRLLLYPHVHVRKETLWLLGNLYNHPQEQVSQAVKDLLPRLANLKLAIQSVTI